jgi:hypothetical protein
MGRALRMLTSSMANQIKSRVHNPGRNPAKLALEEKINLSTHPHWKHFKSTFSESSLNISNVLRFLFSNLTIANQITLTLGFQVVGMEDCNLRRIFGISPGRSRAIEADVNNSSCTSRIMNQVK